MNGRTAILLMVLGTALYGGVEWLSSKWPTKPSRSTTVRATRDQLAGRWSYDQSIGVVGEPLRAHVLITFDPSGEFRQQVQVFHRDGRPTTQPVLSAAGTWSLAGEDLKVQVGNRAYTLSPVVFDNDVISLFANSADIELVPDAPLRRVLSTQPLD